MRLAPLAHRAGAPSARSASSYRTMGPRQSLSRSRLCVREALELALRVRVNARERAGSCVCTMRLRCSPLLLQRVGGVPAPFETGVLTRRVVHAALQRVVLCCACCTAIRGKNDDEINKLKKELAALAKIGQSKKLLDQNEACNIATLHAVRQRYSAQRNREQKACESARRATDGMRRRA